MDDPSILFSSVYCAWSDKKRMDHPSIGFTLIVENVCLSFAASAFPPFRILFFHKNKSWFTSYSPVNAEGHEWVTKVLYDVQ
jgi:hypothetical protein